MSAAKLEWQRRNRRAFVEKNGYSTAANYACGGRREEILSRDNHRCVKCGMSDVNHKLKWGRPITIDHIDKDRSNNSPGNLQTLCLTCHGRKDLMPQLRVRVIEEYKQTILAMRDSGCTFQAIADETGFSIAAIWKWIRIWRMETA